jgi:hypothetical protein
MAPFINPQPAPIASPNKIPRNIPSVFNTVPITQADKAKIDPMDRSIPPVNTTTVRPEERRNRSEDCRSTLRILFTERNSGLTKAKKIAILNTAINLIKSATYRFNIIWTLPVIKEIG